MAGLPFFIVMPCGSRISTFVLHFRQYPSNAFTSLYATQSTVERSSLGQGGAVRRILASNFLQFNSTSAPSGLGGPERTGTLQAEKVHKQDASSLGQAPARTQAIAQKCRETPTGRAGLADLRRSPKWLRTTDGKPLRRAVPKLNEGGGGLAATRAARNAHARVGAVFAGRDRAGLPDWRMACSF